MEKGGDNMGNAKEQKITNVGAADRTNSADKPSTTIRPASTGVKPKK